MKFGAAIPVLNEWRFMPAVTGQLLKVVDRVVLLRGYRSQSGAAVETYLPPPELDSRIEILEGNWSSEAQTRNAGMDHLADCDYVFMVDSDEILLDGDLETLRSMAETGDHQAIAVKLYTYWKTPEYRIDPPEDGTIKMVLRKDVRLHGIREINAPFATADVWCRHLSYVRSDEEAREKIRLSGHAHEIRSSWYENIWKAWDANPALENLHPVHPSAYKRAIKADDHELEAVLTQWGCA